MTGMNEKGSGLVIALLVLMLFTLLGAAALQMGQTDLQQGRLQAQQLRATYLAESGLELAIGWFARPEQFRGRMRQLAGPCPAAAYPGELFAKRCRRDDGAGGFRPSFLTDDGVSQFHGTSQQPDGVMTMSAESLFPGMALFAAGTTLEVRIFRPGGLGAVCTVMAIARTASGAQQAVQVELAEVEAPERAGGWPVVTFVPGSWRHGF